MTAATNARRLPAYGREVREKLNAGMLPAIGGNTVAVCIGWPARCVFAHVVCITDEHPANRWDFDFLAGVESIVWFDQNDPVHIAEMGTSLADNSRAVMRLLAVGELTPDDAAAVMQAMAGQVRIVEATEIESRIAALEQAASRKA